LLAFFEVGFFYGEKTMAKILIVEDEAILATNLKMQLEHLGHEVVGNTGRVHEVVGIAEQTRPEIVFMDIVLKGKVEGITLAEFLCDGIGCKIIFMTGSPEALVGKQNLEKFILLKKPFDDEQIEEAIKQVLSS
jgi:CheY-like chemotaxis protein